MSSEGNIYFECSCHSPEHTVRFSFDPEPDSFEDLYVHIFLNSYKTWYQRVWVAIKYVFGYKCIYGHWDEALLNPDDRDKFFNLAKRFKEYHDNKNKV